MHETTTMTTTTHPGRTSPTSAVLGALASVDSLTIPEIRVRVADGWPDGRLGETLDLLRERGCIVRVATDTYALSIAGRRALRGEVAHG